MYTKNELFEYAEMKVNWGKGPKKSWGKKRLMQFIVNRRFAERPLWDDFEPSGMSATDLQLQGNRMIQQFKGLTPAKQSEVLNEDRVQQIVHRFSTKSPAERLNAFKVYCQTLVGHSKLSTNPSELEKADFEPPQVEIGEGDDKEKVLSVAGRLYADITAVPELLTLRPHIMKHLNNNWVYHLYGSGCNCHNSHASQFVGFSFHFLHGISHWLDDHTHCRTRSNQTLPASHRQGAFPAVHSAARRRAVGHALFYALQRAARQYQDSRQSSWIDGPKVLPFDPIFDSGQLFLSWSDFISKF